MAASRAGIHPFAIETAARLQPGVSGAVVVPAGERTVLFVEGSAAGLTPEFTSTIAALGITVQAIDHIPLDRRHRSKPDYAALAARAAKA